MNEVALKDAIDPILSAMVQDGDAVGVVASAADDNGVGYLGAAGYQDREADAAMVSNTVFYIASMTKAVTSVAALQCVERGQLELDAPVSTWLPALADAPVLAGYDEHGAPQYRRARTPITLRHLLTHTSGLAYTTWNRELYAYRQREPAATPISGPDLRRSAPLMHAPGERWEYGTSTDFAGLAVEAATGLSLADYFAQHIFAPLGMEDTSYVVRDAARSRQAARYLRAANGELTREPPAPDPTFFGGGGGLYSTAADYLQFLSALLRLEYATEHSPLLSQAMFAQLCEDQIAGGTAGQLPSAEPHRSHPMHFFPQARPGWSLGFLLNREALPGRRAAGALGWGGLYNSYYWLDPATRLAGVMFTQVLPFADPRIVSRFDAFEAAVYAHL